MSARPLTVALEGSIAAGAEVALVAEDRDAFVLTGEWAGGGVLAGSEPLRTAPVDADPFELLATHPEVEGPWPSDFVGGGWFGYLGYRLGASVERQSPPPPTRERLPAFVLHRYDHLLRRDADGQWWFEALVTDGREGQILGRLERLRARLVRACPPPAGKQRRWRPEPTTTGHARAVAACRERVAAGDLFQANLSLRLRADGAVDTAAAFARGAAALAPARAAYLAGPWGSIASLSPELFLHRRGDAVRSAPIKGTRARSHDPAADALARSELATDPKDRAENVMIVDLVRNDLGRVCEPGSVEVAALAVPHPRAGVWHLESEVRGRLAHSNDDADLLRAAFAPGSVTGAPKVAAVDVISELESAERQVFTGAIGFGSPCAGLELSVAIRTIESDGRRTWLDVGGGIVADSDPEAEAAEALAKARPVLDAIGGRMETGEPAGPGPAVVRSAPRPLPRPTAGTGVFETVLFDGERLVALDAHLDRICASARMLFDLHAPRETLARTAAKVARELGSPCRVRLTLAADGRIDGEAGPLPDPDAPVSLAPVCLPGGLGPHKLADRRLLDGLSARSAPAVPLLCDLDGRVLEAAWANVFVVGRDGSLATPPTDGRILPGVTRARVIERARRIGIEVSERPVSLTELEGASEVLVTSALRDVRPVGDAGPVGQSLRAAAGVHLAVGGR